MALPTLQPYYITKRSLAAPERVMVRRRVQQDEFKQKWSENSRYFNQADVEASKQREWTSSKAFQERYVKFVPAYGNLRFVRWSPGRLESHDAHLDFFLLYIYSNAQHQMYKSFLLPDALLLPTPSLSPARDGPVWVHIKI